MSIRYVVARSPNVPPMFHNYLLGAPLPRPRIARCAVPGGALGPGFCYKIESQSCVEEDTATKTYCFTLRVPDGLIDTEDQ